MAFRARIDVDLVYWGPEEVEELAPEDVPAPDEAIRPGAYRWQPASADDVGHWVPLDPKMVRQEEGAPSFDQAFYELAKALQAGGLELPKRTAAWCAAFTQTIDAQGMVASAPVQKGKP